MWNDLILAHEGPSDTRDTKIAALRLKFNAFKSLEADVTLQTPVPQDKWSREKHIELVNIISEPLAGITTRSRIRDSDAASASECLYVNFLSEMEPKKLIEALEEEWIIAYKNELNQFEETGLGPLGSINLMVIHHWTPNRYGKNRMGRMELFLRTRQAGCLRGLNQQEGIDCESKLYTVADWKAIRTLFWLCAYMGFMVVPDGLRVLLEWEISEEVLFNNLLGLNACGIYNHVLCWSAKKQSSMAMSSAEAEYVVMLCLCHIKNNPVLHSRTKQFESGFTSSESSILIRTDVHYLPRILTVNGMGLATLGLFDKDKPTLSSNVLVNAVVTTDKSLYRAQCRPITYSNAPTDLKIKMKKNPPSSKPKSPYKVRVILPKKQVVETQHAEVTVATADATQRLEASESTIMDEFDSKTQGAQENVESPYDTESEIKIIKSYQAATISGSLSMPDVDLASTMLYSVSILWSSSRRVVLTHNTVNQIESSITKHVSDSIQSTVPLTVSNTLKEQLPGLLSNALKDTLPQLIKDSIKSSVSD
ncbi:hypothetical protein Tco_0528137 [Tanacetum coccineum]